MTHAYEALTPDVVLDALDRVGLRGDGRLTALSSYENRVYQIHLQDSAATEWVGDVVVAKFYRPGRWSEAQILEEHAFALELQQAQVPLVAPLILQGRSLHHHALETPEGGSADFYFSVSPRRGGRHPELDDPDVLSWLGRYIARIHNVGAQRPFVHRPVLDVSSFGNDSREYLLREQCIPLEVQGAWLEACNHVLQLATEIIANYADSAGASSHFDSNIRLHGDCHPGNVLWTPEGQAGAGPHFVDLDDARMGPAVQDLWMLMGGERAQQSFQLSCLLEGYEQLRPFNRRELALIEPLRSLRIIHYSAWLARRWSDPAFPIHFPHFGSVAYWQGQVQTLHEQIEAMQQAPLQV